MTKRPRESGAEGACMVVSQHRLTSLRRPSRRATLGAPAIRVLSARALMVRPKGKWAFVVSTPDSDRASILRVDYWPL